MNKEINEIFGQNLLKFRKLKGLTQEELSFELDLDKSTIGKYENGTRCPNLKIADRIAKVLGVKLSELVEE